MLAVVLAFVLAGCLAILVEAESDSAIYFTGDRVTGTSQGGIIYYDYRGQEYTIPDADRTVADAEEVPVAVFVDPGDPTRARADSVVRWIDAACVAVWFVVALALLPVALVRQRRRRRRQEAFAASG